MVSQHETCLQILKGSLETLEKKDKKNYGLVRRIVIGVRKVLEKIYTKINLDDIEMLPVLSVVKYELIQLEKVQGEL